MILPHGKQEFEINIPPEKDIFSRKYDGGGILIFKKACSIVQTYF